MMNDQYSDQFEKILQLDDLLDRNLDKETILMLIDWYKLETAEWVKLELLHTIRILTERYLDENSRKYTINSFLVQ